ncbi:glucosidase 2 subunit beta-like isoform X1 [Poecilia formosa]|uniref:glucosidase 2 subunit beta-like isoform X1 n=1 Tax=Poecilia formosa TaxID=48698 RepID=UPI0007B81A12|nr:PREDICTED: glucosidase 2 subunit beta-like isoform X1 [Poecilia formosa]
MEISDLQKKLEIDYGTDWEYLFLNGQCYKLKVYEYMYTLCPFNTVSQKSTEGTEVSLGLWGMWAGPAKNRYSQMVYENGEPCWQGGSRTTSKLQPSPREVARVSGRGPNFQPLREGKPTVLLNGAAAASQLQRDSLPDEISWGFHSSAEQR